MGQPDVVRIKVLPAQQIARKQAYLMRIGSTLVPDRLENHILVTAHLARERYFQRNSALFPEWKIVLGVFRFLEGRSVTPSTEWRSFLTDKKTVELPEF